MNGEHRRITIEYLLHPSIDALPAEDQELLRAATEAASRAYAPYSRFFVGAALRTSDGQVVTGNNQENASFPAGICAERTALHSAMSLDPTLVIVEMAIVVPQITGATPVSPCGICRQALVEQELRQQGPIRLLLGLKHGTVHELASAGTLLPLSFNGSFL